jgi:ferric-dicitrate binding protein FerR (iron transport regulator)
LDAGEEARLIRGRIEKRSNPDIARAVAWRRQGQVYFDNAPLEDIVREFNQRGGATALTLKDIEPGIYRFSGTFDVVDPQSLADILERQSDLKVERRDREILIRSR